MHASFRLDFSGLSFPETAIFVLQERYEKHHQCVFDADALPAAVSLSSRYIPDRYLPDKAIDVMDEAASRVRLQAYETRRAAAWPMGRHDIEEWEILVQVLDAKDEAVQVSFLDHQPSSRCTQFNTALLGSSSQSILQCAFTAASMLCNVLEVNGRCSGGVVWRPLYVSM